MSNGRDETWLTAKRWNYVAIGLITSFVATVLCVAIISAWPIGSDLDFLVVLILTITLMSFAAVYSLLRVVFPTKILLTVDGIDLTNFNKRIFIPWSSYKGMRGGPNLIIAIQGSDGVSRKIAIGMWPVNLEVTIQEYAKKYSFNIPMRESASNQVSIVPLILLAIGLAIFGVIIMAYDLVWHT